MPATNSGRRPSLAPPPTPIATGKGLRTAAIHDEIFSEFLDTSLKIPNLTLPQPFLPSRTSSPVKIFPEIRLSDLISGESAAVRCIVDAAMESGAFRIDGGDVVTCEEVSAALEGGAEVFNSMDARRSGMVSRFGIGEEICWRRWNWKNMEPALEDVPPDTYRLFREKMEVLSAKLEMVANCISFILFNHVLEGTQNHKPPKLQSMLCLRKRRHDRLYHIAAEHDHVRDDRSRFLSIHLPMFDCYNSSIHSSDDSDSCSYFPGSILVTIGEQLKEWCNGQYRASAGALLVGNLFSMEFIMYSPPDCDHCVPSAQSKMISVMDQLLTLFLIVFFFKMQLGIMFF